MELHLAHRADLEVRNRKGHTPCTMLRNMAHCIQVRLIECDVGVNLLSNNSGETSSDPVKFKNVTRPSIVSLKNRPVSGNESTDDRKMFHFSKRTRARMIEEAYTSR
jgi:hypothetical protein